MADFELKRQLFRHPNITGSSRMKRTNIPVTTRHRQALPLPIPLPPAPCVDVAVPTAPLRVAVRVLTVRVGEVRRRRPRGVARISTHVPIIPDD